MASVDTHEHPHTHFHLGAVAGFRVFIIAGILTASLLKLAAASYLSNWMDQLAITLAVGVLAVAIVKGVEVFRR